MSTVNIRKAAAGTEYVGAPPCLQAITCIHLEIDSILRIVLTNIPKAAAGTEYVGAPLCLQAITCI